MKSEKPTNRGAGGQFAKGRSGNPGGRPKGAHDMQEMAREHSVEALETLIHYMRRGKAQERIQAAKIIIERGWGKPLPPAPKGADDAVVVNLYVGEGSVPDNSGGVQNA